MCCCVILFSITDISLMVLLLLSVFHRYVFIHIISSLSIIASFCQRPSLFLHLGNSCPFFPFVFYESFYMLLLLRPSCRLLPIIFSHVFLEGRNIKRVFQYHVNELDAHFLSSVNKRLLCVLFSMTSQCPMNQR